MFTMVISCSSVSFGAGSIIHDDPVPVPDVPDNTPSDSSDKVVIEPHDSDKYDGSPSDIASLLDLDPTKVETTDGLTVNLELYDRITDFYDIGEKSGGDISFKGGKGMEITIRATVTKGLEKSDFLIMLIDPETGTLYLISPDEFDPETGIMSFMLPCYGQFCIIQKLPLVVRDVHPEDYPDEDVAEAVSSLDLKSYQELREWLEAFGIEDDTLEIAKGLEIDVDDYSSADIVSDIAVRLNENNFNYKLSTRVWGRLYQDINECDWGRVLDKAGVDYDADKLKNDPEYLTEIEPFYLKDCFIYQVDAATGEPVIAYEPEISFEVVEDTDSTDKKVKNGMNDLEENEIDLQMNHTDDVDNVNEVEDNVYNDNENELDDPGINNDTSLLDYLIEPAYARAEDHYTKEQREILTFDVNDIDENNEKDLCMIMESQRYFGMGPFLLFMPKESFPWWIILLIVIVLAAAAYIYMRRRRRSRRTD